MKDCSELKKVLKWQLCIFIFGWTLKSLLIPPRLTKLSTESTKIAKPTNLCMTGLQHVSWVLSTVCCFTSSLQQIAYFIETLQPVCNMIHLQCNCKMYSKFLCNLCVVGFLETCLLAPIRISWKRTCHNVWSITWTWLYQFVILKFLQLVRSNIVQIDCN